MLFKCYLSPKVLFKYHKNKTSNMKIKESVRIRKQGTNSLVITIPKIYTKILTIDEGDSFDASLDIEDQSIKLKLVKKTED